MAFRWPALSGAARCSAELAAGVGDPACTLICNTASPGWPLVHGTSTSAEILGSMPVACLPPSTQSSAASSLGSQQQSLWQLFGRPGEDAASATWPCRRLNQAVMELWLLGCLAAGWLAGWLAAGSLNPNPRF